jgi:hypothetical protein
VLRTFRTMPLHITNGDAVVPELAAAAGVAPDDVLVWREILHDGPVPAGLGPDELARLRARHITSRPWPHVLGSDVSDADALDTTSRSSRHGVDSEVSEAEALAMMRERDARLAACGSKWSTGIFHTLVA